MGQENDPRVYFAAERTLLAWLRTGLTVIGLGFVVARFGVFLRMVAQQAGGPVAPHWGSLALGVALVLLGVVAVSVAAMQHRAFCRGLTEGQRPSGYSTSLGLWFAFALAVLGGMLAVYLVLRAEG